MINYLNFLVAMVLTVVLSSCATLTNDPNQEIQFIGMNCSDQAVNCTMSNKRGTWTVDLPGSAMIRRSDDALRVECAGEEGKRYTMRAESRIGAKIVASALFLDLGIVDSITDKHREYPAQIMVDCGG